MSSTITTSVGMGIQSGDYIEISGLSSGEDRKPRFTFWTSKVWWYHLTRRRWFIHRKRRPIYLVTEVKSPTELVVVEDD